MEEQINNFGDFVERLLAYIVAAIPNILGALLILLVGYFIAKALCNVVKAGLEKAGLDHRLHSGQGGNVLQKAVPSPTRLTGKVVFWLVFLFAISAAVGVLGIPLLTAILAGVYAYLPNVLAAILIFLAAGAIAGGVATLVDRTMGDTATGRVVKTVVPVLVMAIAGFMILNQLMIAPAIVTITYAVLLGSTGLGLALAFGLGGRDVAARLVDGAYNKGQQAQRQAVEDVQQSKRKSEVEAYRAKGESLKKAKKAIKS